MIKIFENIYDFKPKGKRDRKGNYNLELQRVSDYYYNRFINIAVSSWKWINLPLTIDPQFLEFTLLTRPVTFFYDDVIGMCALPYNTVGRQSIYNKPIKWRPYASNGTKFDVLTNENGVICYPSLFPQNKLAVLRFYADRIAEIELNRIVNIRASRTPPMIICPEEKVLEMKNVYNQFDGNKPCIIGESDYRNNFTVLTTGAPYLADKFQVEQLGYWTEAMLFLGVTTASVSKSERQTAEEISATKGDVIASRYSAYEARKQACEKINDVFEKYLTDKVDVTFIEYAPHYEIDFNSQVGLTGSHGLFELERTETQMQENSNE